MAKKNKKIKGVSKGAPSGLMISLLVHAGAFFLAGLLVVFSVVKKKEVTFVPPPAIERPKMKLKKPKVKIKKSAKPASPTRIMAKVTKADMPELQLPELGGTGTGFGGIGDLGGFDMMPTLDATTLFGSGSSIGNDFVGTFYDIKRSSSGNSADVHKEDFKVVVGNFIQKGWDTRRLTKYYRSPKKLYASCFMVPSTFSSTAPTAFGESDTGGWCWMAHYKGDLVHADGITFRFWGQADDIMLVRVDGEEVLNASWPGTERDYSKWISNDSKTRVHLMGNNRSVPGDWITLEPGVPLKMEVLCGEVPGGVFDMYLVVEEKGVKYEKNRYGAPIFPIFKTAELTHDQEDRIYEWLVPGQAAVSNGPVFNDFSSKKRSASASPAAEVPETETPERQILDKGALRPWTTRSEKTIEAGYISRIGDKVVLKTAKDKQIKIPFVELSDEDQQFIELSNPPTLAMSFIKSENQIRIQPSPYSNREEPRVLAYTFGAKMRQTSAGAYNHELTAEYFAVGQQLLDDRKFVLLDRYESSFTLTDENKRSHKFRGEKETPLTSFSLHDSMRGHKFRGHLIVVRDSRGVIVAHQTSNEWLFEKLDKLEHLPLGSFFNRTGNRVYPTGPREGRIMN
jgi:hypothetical protein